MDLNAPLDEFIPVVRGNTMRNPPRGLDKTKIYSAQLMLSKYEYDGRSTSSKPMHTCE
jgi:hypothetical protein